MYPTLEKYRGTKSRHTCPACNSRNCFVRYVKENGEYLSSEVGRCNRESKCGYHYKPKQFFADNPQLQTKGLQTKKRSASNYGFADKNGSQTKQQAQTVAEMKCVPLDTLSKPDFIPSEQFRKTLGNYERNNFVNFLLNLFPGDSKEIENVLKMYFVGTYADYRGNYTCFPSLDRSNRVCRAKLIRFNKDTGNRLKGDYDTSSLPAKLKLKDFQYKQIYFGEHLLSKFPNKPLAIVEAEKTAIIASLCFPEFLWLGCSSKSWLNATRLERIGNRQIILYPDADGFDPWHKTALEAQRHGANIRVSALIENHATAEQKADGYDLADYLINHQREINEYNEFTDFYNPRRESVMNDESLFDDFNVILDEQLAIAIYNGASIPEAERICTQPKNLRRIVLNLEKKGETKR